MPEFILDAGKLWRGAIATALVAIGVAVVGMLIIRGLLDIKIVRRTDGGDFVQATTGWYVGAAIVGTILATGLLQALMSLTPAPFRFYGWITVWSSSRARSCRGRSTRATTPRSPRPCSTSRWARASRRSSAASGGRLVRRYRVT